MSSTIIPFGLGGSGGGGLNFFSFGTEDWDQPHDYTTFYGTDGWNLLKSLMWQDNYSYQTNGFTQFYNANTRLGNNTIASDFFRNCMAMNSTVIIPKGSSQYKSLANMFYGCQNFNANVIIENGLNYSADNMFKGCANFNKPIDISSGLDNANNMFSGCIKFNQPIDFANFNYNWTTDMFEGCTSFNQQIDLTCTGTGRQDNMFKNCVGLKANVNLNMFGPTISFPCRMLHGTNIGNLRIMGYNFQRQNALTLSIGRMFSSSSTVVPSDTYIRAKNIYI